MVRGTLWLLNGGLWNLLATGITSFTLQGNELNAFDVSGAKQFSLTPNGVFEWDNGDNFFPNPWRCRKSMLDSGVAPVGVRRVKCL